MLSFALKGDWGDKTLDFWGNGAGLLAFLFDCTTDDVVGDWVRFVKSKQFTDVVGTLWTKSSWDLLVGQT